MKCSSNPSSFMAQCDQRRCQPSCRDAHVQSKLRFKARQQRLALQSYKTAPTHHIPFFLPTNTSRCRSRYPNPGSLLALRSKLPQKLCAISNLEQTSMMQEVAVRLRWTYHVEGREMSRAQVTAGSREQRERWLDHLVFCQRREAKMMVRRWSPW